MGARDRAVDRGARLGRKLRRELGEELRRGRAAAGLSQTEVGRALGWSHTKVGQIERAATPQVAISDLAKVLAVVGSELSARAYPEGSPVRDRAHLALLERFRARLHSSIGWATEVPLPNPGDQRSWDAIARLDSLRVGVECEMRPTDWQELDRRTRRKRRDGGVDRLILVLANTRWNRAFIADHAAAIAASFPIGGRAAMKALASGRDPRGDALVLI